MVKRQTIQYALVSETVKKMRKHASADEIYNAIAKDHPTISRGTVYRNLQRLSELGEIRKREIPGGADRYDFLCTDHYHVVCTKCGQVFDVDMDYMKDLEKTIKNTHGFEFTSHDIIFKGICPDCNK
ncbi:transcriptional repressor [Salmonella enterica subsp. enterica serovar Infantis]|nr:transcriptional repressor [Salmonella enterica subsp. enterica serovar Infantis]